MGQSNSDLAPKSPSSAASTAAPQPLSSSSATAAPPTARGGASAGVGLRRTVSNSQYQQQQQQQQQQRSHGRKKSEQHDLTPPAPFLLTHPSTAATAVTHATASTVTTSNLSASHHVLDLLPHTQRFADRMGQADSKPSSHSGSPSPHHNHHFRPPSRSSTLPVRSTPPPPKVDSTSPLLEKSEQVPVLEKQPTPPSPSSQPVDVPPPAHSDGQTEKESEIPIGYSESPFSHAPTHYIRPPRLPLPIEEEVHTPGSPIITPQDIESTTVLEHSDVEGGSIPRKASVLSSTTADDEEAEDGEAFANDAQWGEIRVPTRLEWNDGGEKIFVTGTFCNWEKKVKLHRNKDRPGFSANVNLRPGTHHVKFLVDGEMTTSDELPTTVDWINILVNYIEVVAPLPATTEDEKQPPAPAEPIPIPGAGTNKDQTASSQEQANRLSDEPAPVSETESARTSTLQESVGPKGEQPEVIASPTPAQKQQPVTPEPKPTSAPPKKKVPRPKYTNQIPDFLVDLDNYHNPEDERYQRAQRVATTLPQPPTLPMFLSKSILNGATPHKDDASVLIMPNHTVLNHLATSSIKNGILATSGTTRYKRKFLTTIMYKPTSDDG